MKSAAESLRRGVDIVGAALLIVVTSPILLVAAAAVLVTSGRPVLFGHWRIGRNGRQFRCWKLRTMQIDAEQRLNGDRKLHSIYVTNGYKIPPTQDPRITAVGHVLRRTYVDELPQLLNVLNGTMSLVGPRPIVEDELSEFGPAATELLSARPGIFGAWTMRGRGRPPYPERARIELDYIRNRSFAADAAILIRSVPVVLRGQEDA